MFRPFVTLAVVLGVSTAALAQQPACVVPPANRVSPDIRAAVTASGSGLNYDYFVTNKADAQQALIRFAVEAFTVSPPVSTAPPGWKTGRRMVKSAAIFWGSVAEPRGVPPGASLGGFRFSSTALPAIVKYLAWGDVELSIVPDGSAPESCSGSEMFENSYKGVTVGPKTPPPFVALDSLNQLIALLHESRRLGWVRRDGVHQSMLTKLREAKRRVEANDLAGANNNVTAFIAEVGRVSCEDVYCRGNQPATSEAYAVLYFNGKYVSERLP
jgi:hypothetical protein